MSGGKQQHSRKTIIFLKLPQKNLVDRHAPIKKYNHRVCRKSPAWMDRSYVEARRKRRRLEKAWKRTRSAAVAQWLGRRTYFDNCVSQHLSGAGSVGRDLN